MGDWEHDLHDHRRARASSMLTDLACHFPSACRTDDPQDILRGAESQGDQEVVQSFAASGPHLLLSARKLSRDPLSLLAASSGKATASCAPLLDPATCVIAARRYAAFVAGAEGVAQPGGAMPAMVLPSNALREFNAEGGNHA
jgi:hypothetical protein